ncbi:MAG: hypothetical protein R3C25_02895 [Hyphomonadaceae bacterium]
MSKLVIVAALLSIAVTAALTWVLMRLNAPKPGGPDEAGAEEPPRP